MEPTINPDEIQDFLRDYRNEAYGHARYFDYGSGSDPRWTPRITTAHSDLLLDDAGSDDYSQFDAQSEYTTTASTVTSRGRSTYTMRSNASSSLFSRRPRRHDDRSSVGQSSAPSVGVPHPTFLQQFGHVHNHTHTQHPGGELWCEFSSLQNCRATFRLDDEAGWIQHHAQHLTGGGNDDANSFPRQLVCWFCDHVPFVTTAADNNNDGFANFVERMVHVREHIFADDRLTSEDARPDFFVVEHVFRRGLLSEEMYKHAMAYDETPAAYRLPGSSCSMSGFAGYGSGSASSRPVGYQQQQQQQQAASWEREQYYDPESERRAEERKQRHRERQQQYGQGRRRR